MVLGEVGDEDSDEDEGGEGDGVGIGGGEVFAFGGGWVGVEEEGWGGHCCGGGEEVLLWSFVWSTCSDHRSLD